MAAVKAGKCALVTSAIKDITGKDPVTFESFLEAHKTSFS